MDGYLNSNSDALVAHYFKEDYKKWEIYYFKNNPMETAIANLMELGNSLQLILTFDHKNTCKLSIDSDFLMNITYLHENKHLYVYSSLFEGISKQNGNIKAAIYEIILTNVLNVDAVYGGGIGLKVEGDMIILHIELDMTEAPSSTLKISACSFVETVKFWRQTLRDTQIINFNRQRILNTYTEFQAFTKVRVVPSPLTLSQSLALVKLNIEELSFSVNRSYLFLPDDNIDVSIQGINLIYQPNYGQISLQYPILTSIPHTIKMDLLVPLIEILLAGAVGSTMQGGGIGYKRVTDDTFQIVMYAPLKLRQVKNEYGLLEFAIKFKESIEHWITIAKAFIKKYT